MKKLYTAHATIKSGRDGSAKTDDGKLDVKLAFPKELGGDGQGTNPEQLFAAGHAACFGSSLANVAKTEGKPLSNIQIQSAVDIILQDDGGFDLAVHFDITAQGQDRATVLALIEKAKNVCAYSRATKGRIQSVINYKESL